MASLFHAVFGICRNNGGTKKSCYKKAISAMPRRRKSKKSGSRKSSSRRSTKRKCSRWGYSKAAGHKVCRRYSCPRS